MEGIPREIPAALVKMRVSAGRVARDEQGRHSQAATASLAVTEVPRELPAQPGLLPAVGVARVRQETVVPVRAVK